MIETEKQLADFKRILDQQSRYLLEVMGRVQKLEKPINGEKKNFGIMLTQNAEIVNITTKENGNAIIEVKIK